MVRQLKNALIFLGILAALTGIVYPLAVTLIAQVAFQHQANGSLIETNGKYLGSELIGQQFDEPGYFWGRLSATQPLPYNASASSGSNYGQLNPELSAMIEKRIEALKAADPDNSQPIPVDLVTCSASGLDPHISPAAAYYQLPRVARQRHLSEAQLRELVNLFTEDRQLGFLGEPRVNILQLNFALNEIK